MNEKQIDFIICYNNEMYLKECLEYISYLEVPEGMQLDTLCIEGAKSMAEGYNMAMQQSEAKYKVYLHQDLFILNKHFIKDILHIFEENPEYGMLGVLGTNQILQQADYMYKWSMGGVYANDSINTMKIELNTRHDIEEVVAIDGMIMITQYDVSWRSDLFDGFDFYDISQCMEFRKKGYKIGIPFQEECWCFHDCGDSKVGKYDYYRKILCEEYKEWGYVYKEDIENKKRAEKMQKVEEGCYLLIKYMKEKEYERIKNLIKDLLQISAYSTRFWCYYNVIQYLFKSEYALELFQTDKINWEELVDYYFEVRFLVLKNILNIGEYEWEKMLERCDQAMVEIARKNMEVVEE